MLMTKNSVVSVYSNTFLNVRIPIDFENQTWKKLHESWEFGERSLMSRF